jgi:hypothetical protein
MSFGYISANRGIRKQSSYPAENAICFHPSRRLFPLVVGFSGDDPSPAEADRRYDLLVEHRIYGQPADRETLRDFADSDSAAVCCLFITAIHLISSKLKGPPTLRGLRSLNYDPTDYCAGPADIELCWWLARRREVLFVCVLADLQI